MRAAEPQNFTGSAAPDRKGISKPPRASHRLSFSSVFISRVELGLLPPQLQQGWQQREGAELSAAAVLSEHSAGWATTKRGL